jgi:hypothetical protein
MNTNHQSLTNKKAAALQLYAIIGLFILFNSSLSAHAQNVGVGLSNPLCKLSINGSLMIDQNNTNFGTLDSAALVFGSAGTTGIISKKTFTGNQHGLSFFTNGTDRVTLSDNGNLAIGAGPQPTYRFYVNNGNSYFDGNINAIGLMAVGGNIDPLYRLRVYDGNTRFGGDMHATGNVGLGGLPDAAYSLRVYGTGTTRLDGTAHVVANMSVGGNPDVTYRLRVYDGNTRLGGDVHATGSAAIGGDIDNNFKLRVYGGNSRFGGDVEVTGNITIGGKGSVKSNGTSPLRIGFDSKSIPITQLGAGASAFVTANITDFAGSADNVRVMIANVETLSGNGIAMEDLNIQVTDVDAATDTCKLVFRNNSNTSEFVEVIVYLTTIAKN